MNVYLVRHAETIDVISKVIQGQDDSNLTANGIIQATKSLNYFSKVKIDRIISSPLGRAVKTAILLSELSGYPYNRIIYDESFQEIDLGIWTKVQIEQLLCDQGYDSYRCYKKTPHLFKPATGEGLVDLQKRVVAGYERLLDTYSDLDNIVIVSHSVAIRTLLLMLEKKEIEHVWEYTIPPASKTKIVVNAGSCHVERIGF